MVPDNTEAGDESNTTTPYADVVDFEFKAAGESLVYVKNLMHDDPSEHIYKVEVDPDGSPLSCTCPHHQFRSAVCKHMGAVKGRSQNKEDSQSINDDGMEVVCYRCAGDVVGTPDPRYGVGDNVPIYTRCVDCGEIGGIRTDCYGMHEMDNVMQPDDYCEWSATLANPCPVDEWDGEWREVAVKAGVIDDQTPMTDGGVDVLPAPDDRPIRLTEDEHEAATEGMAPEWFENREKVLDHEEPFSVGTEWPVVHILTDDITRYTEDIVRVRVARFSEYYDLDMLNSDGEVVATRNIAPYRVHLNTTVNEGRFGILVPDER